MSSDLYGRTRRLELADQNLRSFEAVVLASSPDGIVLSTSAFYPGGGGQPADRGVLLWQGVETRIGGVRKGDDHDADLYKERNIVERLINKLKAWRGIATRYGKTPGSYLAGLHLRASMIWIDDLLPTTG